MFRRVTAVEVLEPEGRSGLSTEEFHLIYNLTLNFNSGSNLKLNFQKDLSRPLA